MSAATVRETLFPIEGGITGRPVTIEAVFTAESYRLRTSKTTAARGRPRPRAAADALTVEHSRSGRSEGTAALNDGSLRGYQRKLGGKWHPPRT